MPQRKRTFRRTSFGVCVKEHLRLVEARRAKTATFDGPGRPFMSVYRRFCVCLNEVFRLFRGERVEIAPFGGRGRPFAFVERKSGPNTRSCPKNAPFDGLGRLLASV